MPGTPLTRFYYLKDHLGSIRVTLNESGGISSYDDYYPFGMLMDKRSVNYGQPEARYKFTSTERDIETGYDYFGARYYDSRIARWFGVDPMEEYDSPYIYVGNNPIRWVDYFGMQSSDSTGKMIEFPEFTVWGIRKPLEHKDVWLVSGQFYAAAQAEMFLTSEQKKLGVEALIELAIALTPIPVGKDPLSKAIIKDLFKSVTNPRLLRALKALFKQSDKIEGGTAGAIRHELKTGELVGGRSHILKGQERIKQLEKILNEENLNPDERKAAMRVLQDLKQALSGNK